MKRLMGNAYLVLAACYLFIVLPCQVYNLVWSLLHTETWDGTLEHDPRFPLGILAVVLVPAGAFLLYMRDACRRKRRLRERLDELLEQAGKTGDPHEAIRLLDEADRVYVKVYGFPPGSVNK